MFKRILGKIRRVRESGSSADGSTSGVSVYSTDAEDDSIDTDTWLSDGLLSNSDEYRRSDFTFLRLYNRLADAAKGIFGDDLDEMIGAESVEDPAEMIMGRAIWKIIAISLATTPFFAYILWTGDIVSGNRLFFVGIGSFLGAGIIGMTLFVGWLVLAANSISDQGSQIEKVLPEAMSFMYAQSKSDVNYLNVIRSMALAEDAYGPVSREFQSIVRRCEFFGEDVHTAIEKQAKETQSDELARILRNLVSHIQNGSNITSFFENEAEKARQRVESKESAAMDFVGVVSSLYATAGLAPVFILAVVVGISSFQDVPGSAMLAITYIITPGISLLFIYMVARAHRDGSDLGVLTDHREGGVESFRTEVEESKMVSSQRSLSSAFGTEDKRGDRANRKEVGYSLHSATDGIINTEKADELSEKHSRFKTISKLETKLRLREIVEDPVTYFSERPQAVLVFTVPLTFILLQMAVVLGYFEPFSVERMIEQPVVTSAEWVYAPLILVFTPLILFNRIKKKRVREIQDSFPDTLHRISGANDAGLSLTEAIERVGEQDANPVDKEMGIVATKAKLGVPIDRALAEFNNVYKQPQIARGTRLLIEAYRASTYVSDVLAETIKSAETALKIRDRQETMKKSQLITTGIVTLSGAVILLVVDLFFIGFAMDGLGIDQLTDPTGIEDGSAAEETGGSVSSEIMSLSIFHAAVIHSFLSGVFMGYLSDQTLINGVKFGLVFLSIVIGLWVYF